MFTLARGLAKAAGSLVNSQSNSSPATNTTAAAATSPPNATQSAPYTTPQTTQQWTGTGVALVVLAVILAAVLVVVAIYFLVRLYKTNQSEYPVLLASPIRGADFSTMPSLLSQPVYPMIDRYEVQYKGVTLPYAGNELSLLQTQPSMPTLNHQVQFTLSFWLRVENLQFQDTGTSQSNLTNYAQYASLFTMNTNQFQVRYNSSGNELVVVVSYAEPKPSGAVAGTPEAVQRFAVYRVPNVLRVQKWQMVTVVLDNRHVDIYVNNEMVRSFVLDNVPYLSDTKSSSIRSYTGNNWTLYDGRVPFGGTVSCARYFHYAFNTHEVYRLHRDQTPRGADAPFASYYFWWTWTRGNTLTGLYRTLVEDVSS